MNERDVIKQALSQYLDESGYGSWVDDEKRTECADRIASALEENRRQEPSK